MKRMLGLLIPSLFLIHSILAQQGAKNGEWRAYGAENGIPILGLDRRVTYVIGENGLILKAYPSVDPGVHANQIIHDLSAEHPPSPSPTASPAASAKAPSPSGGVGGKAAPQAPAKAPAPDEGSDVE